MKYILQVRFNGADAAISKLPAGEQQKIASEFEEISPAARLGASVEIRPMVER